MRLLHTSDWHLGKRLHETPLLGEQAHALDQIAALCQGERIDALIIAGDLYDRAVPPVDAVALLSGFLERVAGDLAIPVVVISGNHDSPDRLGFGASLLARGRVHVRTAFAARAEPIVIERGRRRLHIYGLPYLEPEQARAGLGDESLTSHHAAVDAALAAIEADRAARGAVEAVLMGHLLAAGGRESPDSERPLVLGGAAQVAVPVLARGRWSYVALGHLHEAQAAGDRDDIRYSGSILKYSFNEAEQVKGVNLVEIVCGRPAVRTIRLAARRDLVRITGTFEELLSSPRFAAAESALVQATYTDAGYVLDATARLRRRFPFLCQALPASVGGGLPAGAPRRALGDGELLEGFWSYVEGEAAGDGHVREFARALERVRARGLDRECALAS
jgi:exonuclease SbcD